MAHISTCDCAEDSYACSASAEDVVVLRQLMNLLVTPLADWEHVQYKNCSEWVGAQVKVALLEAHAHCTILADDAVDTIRQETVRCAQDPILHHLQNLWLGMLVDYAVLSRWHGKVWNSHIPSVINVGHQTSTDWDMNILQDAWPVVLQALSTRLPSADVVKSSAVHHVSTSSISEAGDPHAPNATGIHSGVLNLSDSSELRLLWLWVRVLSYNLRV